MTHYIKQDYFSYFDLSFGQPSTEKVEGHNRTTESLSCKKISHMIRENGNSAKDIHCKPVDIDQLVQLTS